jgi:hypothetical protein
MCRSIKQLRGLPEHATEEDIHAAALQFVRKVSGYRAPSRANQEAFEAAVAEVAAATQRLLERIERPASHHPSSHAHHVGGEGLGVKG